MKTPGCLRTGLSRLSSFSVREYAVGAESPVHHGERIRGEDVLAGNCGQQHPVDGAQAAAAAQDSGNREAGAGWHGDHAARVTPGDHHARLCGQGQPVPLAPAQGAGGGLVGDPAGGVDTVGPVHHVRRGGQGG
jgi:hypothetical protein